MEARSTLVLQQPGFFFFCKPYIFVKTAKLNVFFIHVLGSFLPSHSPTPKISLTFADTLIRNCICSF